MTFLEILGALIFAVVTIYAVVVVLEIFIYGPPDDFDDFDDFGY